MTQAFTQFVFFLSTAQEEAELFVGQERSPRPQILRYTRELRPGTYRVADGDVQPLDANGAPPISNPVVAHEDVPESWCAGRVDIP